MIPEEKKLREPIRVSPEVKLEIAIESKHRRVSMGEIVEELWAQRQQLAEPLRDLPSISPPNELQSLLLELTGEDLGAKLLAILRSDDAEAKKSVQYGIEIGFMRLRYYGKKGDRPTHA